MDESKRYGFWKGQFEEVFGGENIDPRELYEKALPCFYEKYDLKEKKDISVIGTTRQGGFPDLPESKNWPVENGKAMSFLAQINLGELEPGFAPYLPTQGWLYFFMGEFQNWVSIPHRILYFDGPVSQLKQTSPPEDSTPPEKIYKSYAISYLPGFTLYGKELDIILDKYFSSGDYPENIFDYFQGETGRVGGHPMSFQNYSEHNAYLALNSFDLLVEYGISSKMMEHRILRQGLEEKEPEKVHFLRTEVYPVMDKYQKNFDFHKKEMQAVRPLFVLSSDGDEMYWGDLGFLQFFIHEDDLAARRFDRTYCGVIST